MTSSSKIQTHRSGYVAFIGRPNAGKSTLLNQLVGQKIAAVSDKPQTTRFRIQGVITEPEGQIVLVDTPGVHKPGYEMNRRMMATVQDALMGVDLVCRLLLEKKKNPRRVPVDDKEYFGLQRGAYPSERDLACV